MIRVRPRIASSPKHWRAQAYHRIDGGCAAVTPDELHPSVPPLGRADAQSLHAGVTLDHAKGLLRIPPACSTRRWTPGFGSRPAA